MEQSSRGIQIGEIASTIQYMQRKANHDLLNATGEAGIATIGTEDKKMDMSMVISADYDAHYPYKQAISSDGVCMIQMNPDAIERFESAGIPMRAKKYNSKQKGLFPTRRQNATTTSPVGYEYDISTTTFIDPEPIYQMFYKQREMAEIFPINKKGGWSDDYVQNTMTIAMANDYGVYQASKSNHQSPRNIVPEYSHIRIPLQTFVWELVHNYSAINNASVVDIDMVGQARRQAMEAHTSLYEKMLFLGSPSANINGLLDYAVTTDTTLITQYLSTMTPTQLNAVFAGFVSEYQLNSASTVPPDTFLISALDASGQGAFVSPDFPILQIYDAIENAFKKAVMAVYGQEAANKCKVISSMWLDEANNGSQTAYFMYNRGSDNIEQMLPIAPTFLGMMSYNGWNFNEVFFFRSGGIYIKRPQTVYKFLLS